MNVSFAISMKLALASGCAVTPTTPIPVWGAGRSRRCE
jgi:hypothetical protein